MVCFDYKTGKTRKHNFANKFNNFTFFVRLNDSPFVNVEFQNISSSDGRKIAVETHNSLHRIDVLRIVMKEKKFNCVIDYSYSI